MVQSEFGLMATYQALRRGQVTRREFLARAATLGIGAQLALVLVSSVSAEGVTAQVSFERPSAGTSEQVRGGGGVLKVRQWFAPSHVFTHLPGFPPSGADISSLILEPLLAIAPDGSLMPNLATEVPTRTNGGLSEDLTKVTLNLREHVLWSDGEPLTAQDVVWTWQWITDESNGSWNHAAWSLIQAAEAIGPTTVELTYANPSLPWFFPIAGSYFGSIIPSHIWEGKEKAAVNADFAIEPIGTGPYRIDSFVPGDHVVCSINEQYREPNKPWFATVHFQGGGDSAVAAQAVLQDGDWDVATTLQMQPEVLRELESTGEKGKLVSGLPTTVERIVFNFSDPNIELDGERSSLQTAHPFLTDRAVRQAMAMSIDRESIANEIFLGGDLQIGARNILTGIPWLESPNTSIEFNIEAANELLDTAGWGREGNSRTRDGVELAVSFYTSVTGPSAEVIRFRAELQNAVKEGWEAIGIRVELGQLSGEDFFSTTPENELSYAHFYRDIQMYAITPDFPLPDLLFLDWYAGPDNRNVAQLANNWTGLNIQRYVNSEFDRLYEEATATTDPELAAGLYMQMNDLLVGDYVVVPLIARSDQLHAISNRLVEKNVATNSWEPLFWNIANWRTVEE